MILRLYAAVGRWLEKRFLASLGAAMSFPIFPFGMACSNVIGASAPHEVCAHKHILSSIHFVHPLADIPESLRAVKRIVDHTDSPIR